jgi:hypothetical protein
MLRKGEDNIFANIGSQVHAIVDNRHLILAFEGQVAGPMVQLQPVFVGLEAAGALALQREAQTALHEHCLFEPLSLNIVGQGAMDVNELVQGVHVEIRNREFALEMQVLFFQMTKIEKQ